MGRCVGGGKNARFSYLFPFNHWGSRRFDIVAIKPQKHITSVQISTKPQMHANSMFNILKLSLSWSPLQ